MLLKDCPVGSVVRLASLCGDPVHLPQWRGKFQVINDGGVNFVIDGDGDKRKDVVSDADYQFDIISMPAASTRTLTLSGTTYTLTPYEAPKLVTIDDVVYVMTEVV